MIYNLIVIKMLNIKNQKEATKQLLNILESIVAFIEKQEKINEDLEFEIKRVKDLLYIHLEEDENSD